MSASIIRRCISTGQLDAVGRQLAGGFAIPLPTSSLARYGHST